MFYCLGTRRRKKERKRSLVSIYYLSISLSLSQVTSTVLLFDAETSQSKEEAERGGRKLSLFSLSSLSLSLSLSFTAASDTFSSHVEGSRSKKTQKPLISLKQHLVFVLFHVSCVFFFSFRLVRARTYPMVVLLLSVLSAQSHVSSKLMPSLSLSLSLSLYLSLSYGR